MSRPGEVHSEGCGGNIDMFAVDVRVAQNHSHGFVAADLHDGRNVGFGAHESGDGGVPHDVRRDGCEIAANIDPAAIWRIPLIKMMNLYIRRGHFSREK